MQLLLRCSSRPPAAPPWRECPATARWRCRRHHLFTLPLALRRAGLRRPAWSPPRPTLPPVLPLPPHPPPPPRSRPQLNTALRCTRSRCRPCSCRCASPAPTRPSPAPSPAGRTGTSTPSRSASTTCTWGRTPDPSPCWTAMGRRSDPTRPCPRQTPHLMPQGPGQRHLPPNPVWLHPRAVAAVVQLRLRSQPRRLTACRTLWRWWRPRRSPPLRGPLPLGLASALPTLLLLREVLARPSWEYPGEGAWRQGRGPHWSPL
jgi:hypothetical protein